ncbi:Endonuclease/Exonuclease/phosphatase family protein [Nocardioides sp. J9]|uniref:hypothetical protein n=1 Tax=Nocardioides sp. J9 TaxID=935844 RepID=UPI0011A7B8D6|nr:hypothetical protein [Nocardioides sp. J9]TWG92313.1 Endonuclease/Exonuclease/phosphatase family protein [Nocardioides sp. J9]
MSYRPRPVAAGTVPGVLVAVLLGLLAAVGAPGPAQAARTPTVTGLAAAGQDWAGTRLKVRWKAVPGATYQVRWARSQAALSKATVQRVTTRAATSPTLGNRCVTWYAQVRAVRQGTVGAWSRPRGLRFTLGPLGTPRLAAPSSAQVSEQAVRFTWTAARYAARYRLDWSAAAHGQWADFSHNYTRWQASGDRSATIPLPATPAAGDRFLAPAYGNAVFAQLQYDTGCTSKARRTQYVGAFPRPRDPGTGDLVSVGSYNVELSPTTSSRPRKIANIADNIARRGLDVVALQEAREQTAKDLVRRLADAEGQKDWTQWGVGAQRVLWRTGAWRAVLGGKVDVGRASDKSAATPLPAPAVRLTPALGAWAPGRQDIFVVSVHLEDRRRFDAGATVKERKRDAHLAASALLDRIAAVNRGGVPTLVLGDLKGNFGGGGLPAGAGYCDENAGCVGEGQPTFVRAGFWDAQSAVTKVGVEYGTLNKHVARPPRSVTGVGGRTDYILARGTGGFTFYRNVVATYGDASAIHQPDHNLLVARVVVPRR